MGRPQTQELQSDPKSETLHTGTGANKFINLADEPWCSAAQQLQFTQF